MTKREQKKRLKQAQVLDNARGLINENGAAHLTMANLAKRMNASVGGLYRYYPSKETIFAALQSQALDALRVQIESTRLEFESSGRFDWSLICALFDSWSYFERKDPLSALILNHFTDTPQPVLELGHRTEIGTEILKIISVLAKTIEQLTQLDCLTRANAHIRALQLWGMIFGFEQLKRRQTRNISDLPIAEVRAAYLTDLRRAWCTMGA